MSEIDIDKIKNILYIPENKRLKDQINILRS